MAAAEDSSGADEDLLGMRSLPAEDDGSSPPANDDAMEVNVVDMGGPIDDAAGGGRSSRNDPARMKRRKSPAREVGRMIKSSINRGHRGGGQRQPSSARRQQGSRRGGGDKMYQGRISRNKRQQSSQSQQQQREGEPSQQQPRSQQQQQSQQPHPYHQNRQRRGAYGAQQWSEMTDNIRRRSRDGVAEIRRKSRDGAERMRRMSINAGNTMRRRVSISLDHDDDRETRQRSTNEHRRRASRGGGGRDDGLSNTEHRELERLRNDARQGQGDRDDVSGTQPSSRILDGSDEMDRLGERTRQKKRNNSSERPKKFERQMSKSMGHALKGDVEVERRHSKSMFDDEAERKHSMSVFAGTGDGIGDDDESDDSSIDLENEKERAGQVPKRDMLSHRRASLDSSLRDLQAQMKKAYEEEEAPSRGRRRPARRRQSLDSSMKLGESATKKDLEELSFKMRRRRSNSADNCWKKKDQDPKDIATRRRQSVDRDEFGGTRRRSLSLDGDSSSKKKDDLMSDIIRGEDIDDERLQQLFGKYDKEKEGRHRRTHSGAYDVNSPKESSKRTSGGIRDKRKSDGDLVKKERLRDRDRSKRGSYDERKLDDKARIEAAKRSWDGKHTKAAAESAKSKSKRRSERKSENYSGSSSKKTQATDGTAEESVNSSQCSGEDHSGKYSGKSSSSRKSRGCRLSPIMLCTLCLCYCLSIVLFGGLGFWVHMKYFDEDDGTTTESSLNDAVEDEEGSSVDTKSEDRGDGGAQGSITTPDLGLSNVTGPSTTVDGSLSTAAPTSSLLPTYSKSPTGPPKLAPTTSPSYVPTSSSPTDAPTYIPTPTPSVSIEPTPSPSYLPSSSPTFTPECPEQLLESAPLGTDGLLTLRYEVIVYQSHMDGGGLLCAQLDYAGGGAAWLGLAFSEASRLPQYGRKEAIIGIPGLVSTSPMAKDGKATLGQQMVSLETGPPAFVNPGKYELPPGGIGKDAYSGPSLSLLSKVDKQTLINGSVSTYDLSSTDGIILDQGGRRSRMSFVKYLSEPGEIEVDPFGETLLLYAVAGPVDGEGGYDGNPEWGYTRIRFLEGSAVGRKSGPVRKRKRAHETNRRR